MSLKKRLIAIIAVICVVAGTIAVSVSGMAISEKQESSMLAQNDKKTIYIWYTDEALSDYINSAAVSYSEGKDVRIMPVLESGLEYLEGINRASLDNDTPDLYVLSHDSLEKAYLAGLASEVDIKERATMQDCFPQTAIDAVTYEDKIIGYPLCFETNALLYNKTYLQDEAKKQIEEEADIQAAEEATAQLEENGAPEEAATTEAGDEGMPDLEEETTSQEAEEVVIDQTQIEERMQELLPKTIEDIKTFADEYDAPEQVESIFKWDVTDLFYNYFFIGDAVSVGGDAGWNAQDIDIYNAKAIESMQVYQDLNQFFSIDTSEISYENVMNEFIEGKLLFTVATSDAIAKLEQAKEEGTFAYEYGITNTPNINENLASRPLSMTSCVVVNGYSENSEHANDFAYYLTVEYADILYNRTGKLAATTNVTYEDENQNQFAQEYALSIPMPKMIVTSNYWLQMEIAFSQIWDGADANSKLKELAEQIMTQVTGAPYAIETITDPEQETEEIEYLDEEYYRSEALDDGTQSEEE